MMAQKAKLFHDSERYTAILRSTQPWECKDLGKHVKPFDSNAWNAVKYDVVKTANRAKYEQNPDPKAKLMDTGDAILAEASPKDTIWGIGLDAVTAAETNPSEWPSQNLLGKNLMELRSEFAGKKVEAEKTVLQMVQGDITRISGVDAIISAADKSLLGGDVLACMILHAAGPKMLADCYPSCTSDQSALFWTDSIPFRQPGFVL